MTGFGLLGHLGLICRASHVGAEVIASKVPVIDKQVLELISAGCVPGGSRDNLALWKFVYGMGRNNGRGENALDGCADERRLVALRVPKKHLQNRSETAAWTRALRGDDRAHRALAPAENTSIRVKHSALRRIPSVRKTHPGIGRGPGWPRLVVLDVVRRELAALRTQKSVPGFDVVLARVRAAVRDLGDSAGFPASVINGTGNSLIHTNFGRAAVSVKAVDGKGLSRSARTITTWNTI